MNVTEHRVRIPQLASVELAVEMYYAKVDLSNSDIKLLFGGISHSKISQLKGIANRQREADGRFRWDASRVDTVSAYKAWGFDIADLEKRLTALKRMERRREQDSAKRSGVLGSGTVTEAYAEHNRSGVQER